MGSKKDQYNTEAVASEINRHNLSLLIAQTRHLDTDGISVSQLAMLFGVSLLAITPEPTPEGIADRSFVYANAFMDRLKTEIASKD